MIRQNIEQLIEDLIDAAYAYGYEYCLMEQELSTSSEVKREEKFTQTRKAKLIAEIEKLEDQYLSACEEVDSNRLNGG